MEVQRINNKIYTELYEKQSNRFSFYHSAPWFLGLSANPKILACYDQSEIVAVWPFDIIKRLYVLKCLSQAPFVSNLGPIFLFNHKKFNGEFTIDRYKSKLVNLFLNHIDEMKVDCVNQDLIPKYQLPHLMKFRDYKLNYKHSYFLPKNLSEEEIWTGMNRNHRYKIKKMLPHYHVEKSENYDDFYGMISRTFNRLKIKSLQNKEVFVKAIKNTVEKNCGVLLCLKDKDENPLSYGFMGWDHHRMYYAIGANDVNKSKDTISLYILWEGIKLSREKGLDFDFEGTMLKELDPLYAGFGSQRDVYVNISRANNSFSKLLFKLNELRS